MFQLTLIIFGYSIFLGILKTVFIINGGIVSNYFIFIDVITTGLVLLAYILISKDFLKKNNKKGVNNGRN